MYNVNTPTLALTQLHLTHNHNYQPLRIHFDPIIYTFSEYKLRIFLLRKNKANNRIKMPFKEAEHFVPIFFQM